MEIPFKGRRYEFVVGWPTVKAMSRLMNHFYNNLGQVTEEMERTQYGINFVMAFIKKVRVFSQYRDGDAPDAEIDLD